MFWAQQQQKKDRWTLFIPYRMNESGSCRVKLIFMKDAYILDTDSLSVSIQWCFTSTSFQREIFSSTFIKQMIFKVILTITLLYLKQMISLKHRMPLLQTVPFIMVCGPKTTGFGPDANTENRTRFVQWFYISKQAGVKTSLSVQEGKRDTSRNAKQARSRKTIKQNKMEKKPGISKANRGWADNQNRREKNKRREV